MVFILCISTEEADDMVENPRQSLLAAEEHDPAADDDDDDAAAAEHKASSSPHRSRKNSSSPTPGTEGNGHIQLEMPPDNDVGPHEV